ncbi:MAG: hypothetical protein KDA71_04590, partial [Planctomycetales bacterium]|nr:hypothetical protein [Planctomycetales bacterium]
SHGHTTIEGLVGIAIDAMATRRLAQIAETYDIPPELIKQTLATMDATSHTMVTFKDLLDAEKILGRNIIDDFFEVPGDVVMLTTNSSIDLASHARAPTDGWHRLAVAIRKLYLPDRAMHRNLNRFYDEVEKSVVDHADGTPGTVVNHERALSQVPPWDVIDANVLPGFDRIYELTLRYHSEHERARLRIAIAAYRRRTGQLPPTLDALVPAFLDHIPVDPMTGADFAYQPRRDESNALVGLETIDSRRMDLLRAQRIAPSIRGPRESKWRRYVARFSERYQLSAAQRTSAETILRDIESRAADFETTHGAKIETLIEEGKVDAARKQTVALDALFEQLCQRLNRLPTVQQRASANSKTGDTPDRRP